MNSKIDLYYLVFDDDPNAETIHKQNIGIKGCECHIIYINPKSFYNVETNSFDNQSFQQDIIKKTQGKAINVIVTDWNIIRRDEDFDGVCGWDIIKNVIEAKEKLRHKPFLIYSSNLSDVSTYIVDNISKEIKDEQSSDLTISRDFIRKLLELKIKFCKRTEDRFEEIKTLLNQTNTISNMVLNTVHSYEDHIINMGNEIYDGKKIKDIISSYEPDNGGLKFIREFMELSIAHYTKLNNDRK